MKNKSVLIEVCERLVDAYNPLFIYIFGSYAWGNPSPDSDLDILVVVDESEERSYKRSLRGYDVLFGLGLSKDIIVLTQQEFQERSMERSSLAHSVKKRGKLIYERV